MNTKKKALGRGLSALLESPDTDITSKDITGNYVVGAIANISLEKIETNPFQPRTVFEKKELTELADSIKEQGIIQPITVRKLGYEKYQLISGERRLKAAKLAGLAEVPAYIRVANDQQMLEMTLVENIQRKNLNAIEIAISYQRLIEECSITQEEMSKRVGKDRTTITNYLRLLKLPAEIQIGIRDNKITMGHARSLISIDDSQVQLKIFETIIKKELSVRDVEEIVRNLTIQATKKHKLEKTLIPLSPKYESIKKDLTDLFETKIEFKRNNKGKGSIIISFNSEEDLERIIKLLSK